jgi:hypothetical protein
MIKQGWRLADRGHANGQNSQHLSHRHFRGADARDVRLRPVLIKQLETFAAKAQALADRNPLLIADVEYYASALADAQRCAKNLGAVATVAR